MTDDTNTTPNHFDFETYQHTLKEACRELEEALNIGEPITNRLDRQSSVLNHLFTVFLKKAAENEGSTPNDADTINMNALTFALRIQQLCTNTAKAAGGLTYMQSVEEHMTLTRHANNRTQPYLNTPTPHQIEEQNEGS